MDVQYFSVDFFFIDTADGQNTVQPVEMAKTASNIIYTITFIRIWF